MSNLADYSDEELASISKKLTAQLVEINCELQKRDAVKKMKMNLRGELSKIKADSMSQLEILSGRVQEPPRAKGSAKKEVKKKETKTDSYKSWTVKKMQNFLDSKRIEYKKTLARDDLIKVIQSKSMVREMNNYA